MTGRSNGRSLLGALAIAVGAWGAAGCDAPTANGFGLTTSTLSPCWLDAVTLDPDGEIVTVEPGCDVDFDLQVSGPGGEFDLFMEDSAGGSTISADYDAYFLSDGDRFRVTHGIGASWADDIEVSVDLLPSHHHGGCEFGSRGASTSKTFPVNTAHDCVVTFRVTDEVDIGGIWFEVDYGASDADVPGCSGAPACVVPLMGSAWGVGIDDDSARRLLLGWAGGQGFSAPVDLVRCNLRKTVGADDPTPADFAVAVTDSYSPLPLGRPLNPPPNVAVEIDCSPGSTTTTTLAYEPAECGHPCSGSGSRPTALDALYVLQAAIGTATCKTCICDVNRSGVADATDALAVLTQAVGLDAVIRCVICAEAVPPSCG